MNHDLVLNTVFFVIYASIFAILYVQYYLKPFKIELIKLATCIELRYWHGLKWRKARVIFSDKVQHPKITRNFTHFNFVLPLNSHLWDIQRWLIDSEIQPIYFSQGREELELLRAVLLGYVTRDLDAMPLFKNKANRLKVLKAIRKNRHVLKEFTDMLYPNFDYSKLVINKTSWLKQQTTKVFKNFMLDKEDHATY